MNFGAKIRTVATFRFYNNSSTSRVPIANWLAIGPA